MIAYLTGSNLSEIGDLVSKVKVAVTSNPFFFLHNSLLPSYFRSKLLCPIKMKIGILLIYALGRFVFAHKSRMGNDVIVTQFKFFSQTIVHVSNSIEPTNFILGTSIQQHH